MQDCPGRPCTPPPAQDSWAGRKGAAWAPPWPPRGPPPRTPVSARLGHPQRPEPLRQLRGLQKPTAVPGRARLPQGESWWRAAPCLVGAVSGRNLSVRGRGGGGWEQREGGGSRQRWGSRSQGAPATRAGGANPPLPEVSDFGAFVSIPQNLGVQATEVLGPPIPQKIKSIMESNEEPQVLIKLGLIKG